MKRKIIISVILILLSLTTLFGLDISLVTSYENSTSFTDKVKISVGLTTDQINVLISEYGLKKIDIDARIGHFKTNDFFINGLLNTSYSYGLGGYSGMGVLFNYSLLAKAFSFKIALGAQGTVSYGPYQSAALFSITPLVEASIGLALKNFSSSIYLSFSDPFEREWKALPTIGLKALISISNFTSVSADAFAHFAEYLVDPVTLIMSYGFRLGCVINCDKDKEVNL